ncbi:MAG TPA: helix-turn-helix domain-containing protein [Pseudobdellovibrionaceae bacterium]
MSRTMMIMVSDNVEAIENAKKQWEHQDVTFQVYSPTQWREGMESSFFRQQLMAGVPALAFGSSSVSGEVGGANILAFPAPSSTYNTTDIKIRKMDELEAHAIENAIVQYKGNLTEAAKALGIGRATLYRKVKQYHIDPSQARKKRAA